MMRIVQLTTVHSWNDVRVFQKIARSLSQAGYDVHVIAPEPDCKPEDEERNNTSINFDPNDLASMLLALERVAYSDDLRTKLISLGYKTVRKYGWDKCAEKTRAIYKQVRES